MRTKSSDSQVYRQLGIIIWVLFIVPILLPPISSAWEPSKPITVVIGSNPGGGFDTVGRHTAMLLPKYLGNKQPVIVKNVPGAAYRIALNLVRRSRPDGHTIGLVGVNRLQTLRAFDLIDYNPVQEFTIFGGVWMPPTSICIVSTHTAVRPLPEQTWEELKKIKKPVRIASYANAGEIALIAAFDILKIPYIIVTGYTGTSDAKGGLLRGEADIIAGAATMIMLENVKQGDWAPLTTLTEKRYKGVPQLGIIGLETTPSVAELGLDEFGPLGKSLSRTWYAPKNMPLEIHSSLESALRKISEDPQTKQWSKKTHIPMMWTDRQSIIEVYEKATAVYKRHKSIALKIGLIE